MSKNDRQVFEVLKAMAEKKVSLMDLFEAHDSPKYYCLCFNGKMMVVGPYSLEMELHHALHREWDKGRIPEDTDLFYLTFSNGQLTDWRHDTADAEFFEHLDEEDYVEEKPKVSVPPGWHDPHDANYFGNVAYNLEEINYHEGKFATGSLYESYTYEKLANGCYLFTNTYSGQTWMVIPMRAKYKEDL